MLSFAIITFARTQAILPDHETRLVEWLNSPVESLSCFAAKLKNRLVKKSIDPEVTTLLRYFINDVK